MLLVPLSPLLIFGFGPFPALGIAGGGVAMLVSFAAGAAVLGWYVLSGRSLVRLRAGAAALAAASRDILRVGAVASVSLAADQRHDRRRHRAGRGAAGPDAASPATAPARGWNTC